MLSCIHLVCSLTRRPSRSNPATDLTWHSQRVTSKTTIPPGVHARKSTVCDMELIVCSAAGKNDTIKQRRQYVSVTRSNLNPGIFFHLELTSSPCFQICDLPNAKDMEVRRIYSLMCTVGVCIGPVMDQKPLQSLFTLFHHPQHAGNLFQGSRPPQEKAGTLKNWMNTVKQSKWFRKWKIYCRQLFLTVLGRFFPLNCQIYCLFRKPNHEWPLKHVLDKRLLIYRTTDRTQVGYWTWKGFFFKS